MSVTLTENTRVDITIQPWALLADDGSTLSEPIYASWFTSFSPLYSHPNAVLIELGGILSDIPTCTVLFAIYEASRWADIIDVGNCDAPNTAYHSSVRWRYVTLLAAIKLLTNTSVGSSSVIEKTLGDLTIRYGDRALQKSLIGRLLDELKGLEPVVAAGGCEGIGTGPPSRGASKGAYDPYRPFPTRGWMVPNQGENPAAQKRSSPGYNYYNRFPDRYQKGSPYSNYGRW